jgi:hypothetical protein
VSATATADPEVLETQLPEHGVPDGLPVITVSGAAVYDCPPQDRQEIQVMYDGDLPANRGLRGTRLRLNEYELAVEIGEGTDPLDPLCERDLLWRRAGCAFVIKEFHLDTHTGAPRAKFVRAQLVDNPEVTIAIDIINKRVVLELGSSSDGQ